MPKRNALTDDERAELERLRAEKAAQDEMAEAHAKRVARERALMDPGDDLSMPLGQKIVLAVVALAVLIAVAMVMFSARG